MIPVVKDTVVERVLIDSVCEDGLEFVSGIEDAHFSRSGGDEGLNHFLGNWTFTPIVHGPFGIPNIAAIASLCCSFLSSYKENKRRKSSIFEKDEACLWDRRVACLVDFSGGALFVRV
jgi:hypothetical protein